MQHAFTRNGILYALAAAVLFGASAPFAKFLLGDTSPQAMLGFFGYGPSLVLFVMALRRVGTTRTITSFSVAPFVGTLIGLALFRESPTPLLIASGLLMALGVWVTATTHSGKSRS